VDGLREHVDTAHSFERIAKFHEVGDVPGKCLGVAGNHYYPGGRVKTRKSVQDVGTAAGTRWIDDNGSRGHPRLEESFHPLLNLSPENCDVGRTGPFDVVTSMLYRKATILDSIDLRDQRRDENSEEANTAIEIENHIVSLGREEFEHLMCQG